MFERFTSSARRVMVAAQDEARSRNHSHIGTEHLLLGVLREEDGVTVDVLEQLGVARDVLRGQIEEMIGVGSVPPGDQIPFSPRAKKAMELALREALQLGHKFIGPEHLLLGLIREGEGVAGQLLVRLGADLTGVERAVLATSSGATPTRSPDTTTQRLDRIEAAITDVRDQLREVLRLLGQTGG